MFVTTASLEELLLRAADMDERSAEEKQEARELAHLFDHFAGNFAKWRWHTMHVVLKSILYVLPGLLMLNQIFSDLEGEFNIKDMELWAAFKYCLASPDFWKKAKCLFKIASRHHSGQAAPAPRCLSFTPPQPPPPHPSPLTPTSTRL